MKFIILKFRDFENKQMHERDNMKDLKNQFINTYIQDAHKLLLEFLFLITLDLKT